jgi:hypothetical protein
MKIRNLDLTGNPINEEHQELGLPPIEEPISHPGAHPFLQAAMWVAVVVLIVLVIFLIGRFFFSNNWSGGWQIVVETLSGKVFWSAAMVGFLAQVIGGARGMAYGVTATSFLLATGATPGAASASVHMAEIFTTGVSGISHVKFGNVNKDLFMRLLVPGILGIYILSKAFRPLRLHHKAPEHVGKLALFGGFVDAAGGGGWGPVVTSTLVGSGNDPRTTIGSVNFAEFFLTLTGAAVLCKTLHARTLLILVGILIVITSLYNLYRGLFS